MVENRNSLTPFFIAILGIGCLSAMDGAVKAMSLDVGAFAALSWRLLASVPLVAIAYLLLRKGWPTRKALRFHIMRGLLTVPMAFLFFYGLERVPMAQAIALAFLAPLFAIFLAALLLKEKVGGSTLVGAGLAFGGTLVIFFGQAQAEMGDAAMLGGVAILGSALLYGFNIILMREQALNADPIEIGFFTYCVSATGFWALAFLLFGGAAYPEGQDFAVAASAVTGVAGTLLLAWAYARASASYLSATEYSGFLWAALFGFVLFGEVPLGWTIVGAAAILCGVWIASRPAPTGHEMIEA